MMTLFDVLAKDQRIIVYSSEEDQCFFTWNQSDTIQRWSLYNRAYDEDGPDEFEETGILTQSGYGPKTYDQARKVAIAWYTDSL